MKPVYFLKNKVLHYDWGSPTLLPHFLKRKNPKQQPQAELWMGAHPKSPSCVLHHNTWTPLYHFIQEKPAAILGKSPALEFSNQLPFLFKILAVNQPLSLQVHPDQRQAAAGFRKENAKKIPLDAPERNFKDPNAKPEIICAITPFWALSGFRKAGAMLDFIKIAKLKTLSKELEILRTHSGAAGLQKVFTSLMMSPPDRKSALLEETLKTATQYQKLDPAFLWITRLAKLYPKDMGILSPLFLNIVHLQPGEAIFLPAKQLHSYLEGFAVELMGNSDNVLRGGLTSKHLDLEGLLNVLDFSSRQPEIIRPVKTSKTEKSYPTHTAEFELSVIELVPDQCHRGMIRRNIEIMICVEGAGKIRIENQDWPFSKGKSWLVPAQAPAYELIGKAKIFKATVPF